MLFRSVQVVCYSNFSLASVPSTSISGTIANNQLANSSITINGTSTSLGGSYTNASASTSTAGIVQLTDSTSSTSTTTAATPNSVKSAYDLANGAIAKTLTTTTGDIIYASSANTPARLGIGSSGQILTVSGGIPSWAAASSGGGMTLLESGSFGTSASVTTGTLSGAYKDLVVYIYGTTFGTGSANLQMRLNSDTGSNYANDTGSQGNNYPWSNNSMIIAYQQFTNSNAYVNSKIIMTSYSKANTSKIADSLSFGRYSSTTYSYARMLSSWSNTAAITTLTFFPSAGNFVTGTYEVYGVI